MGEWRGGEGEKYHSQKALTEIHLKLFSWEHFMDFCRELQIYAVFPKEPLGIAVFQILWVNNKVQWCFQVQNDWKRSVSPFWVYFVTDFLFYLKCSQADKKQEKRDLYRKRKVTTLVN